MIGVCDYRKEASSRSCYSNGNAIAYDGYGNRCLHSGYNIAVSGFKEGDTVIVKVSLSATKVQFYVNGSLSETSTKSIISDSSRKFYPYV
jgi:predicted RNA-binding protein with TRAM domain